MKQKRSEMKKDILRTTVIKLPHEHDETVNLNPIELQPVIVQAAKDIAQGLVDTGRSAAADVAYKKLKRSTD
jgi:hypothetical protein